MARGDRTGNRKARGRRQVQKVPNFGYFLIITGKKEKEINYLLGLRDSLSSRLKKRLVVKVINDDTDKLVELCKRYVDMEPQYCQPWVIVDADSKEDFDHFVKKAKEEGINVCWSNPGIETWFGLHFADHIEDEKVADEGFRETYKQFSGKEYDKSDKEIYDILQKYGSEEKAISLAEDKIKHYNSNGVSNPTSMVSCTTLHMLVKEIREKAAE